MIVQQAHTTNAQTFFVDSLYGSDENSGQSETLAWKTLCKVNDHHTICPFKPGDCILLRNGQTFVGSLVLRDVHGTKNEKITFSSYQAIGDSDLNRPVIMPRLNDRTAIRSVHFKNCSNVIFSNLEIKRGNVCVSFNDDRISSYDYSGIIFKRVYFHGVDPSNVSSGALMFTATKINSNCINNITIEKCAFEGIRCHSVLFNVVYSLSHSKPNDEATDLSGAVFSDVTLTNNETINTTSSSFQLTYITRGSVVNNVISNSGKFFDDCAQSESSGISLSNCDSIIIEGNIISGSYGVKRSTAIVVGPNSHLLLIQKNKSTNNFGGFIMFLGGTANNCVRYNVSIGDGERVKDAARQFIPGKSVSFSDYVGWDHDFNQPIKSPIKYTYIYNNYFNISGFCDHSNSLLSSFGHCRGVLFSENTIVANSDSSLHIRLSLESSLFNVTNNVVNGTLSINNKDVNSDTIQTMFKRNSITFVERESNGNITTNVCDKHTSVENVFIFDEDVIGVYNHNNVLSESTHIAELTCDYNQLLSTNSLKDKSILCIICYSAKKINSLMNSLIANNNISFMNRDIAQMLGVSPPRFTTMLSNGSSILRHNRTVDKIKVSSGGSEAEAHEHLLDFAFNNTKSGSILLLGDQFLINGEMYIDSFINKITQHSINLRVVLLVNNIFEEIQYKFCKRIETAPDNTVSALTINLFIQHLNDSIFISSENILTRIRKFIEQQNFFSSDFCIRNQSIVGVYNFWKALSKKSIGLTDIFEQLAVLDGNECVVDEECVDPIFFPFITNVLKLKSVTTQQQEIEEIKRCQLKYGINTESSPLLALNKDSIDSCNKHIHRLEQIGKFKFFKRTAFLTNGYDNSTKYVKINFHEVDANEGDTNEGGDFVSLTKKNKCCNV